MKKQKIKTRNDNLKFKIIPLFFFLAFIFAFLAFNGPGEDSPAGALDDFARCLAEKNITMYGADWCPHCQNEKRAFGNSFRFVPYVECPREPKKCLVAGINGYPTWLFPNDKKLEGEQGIEKLSLESACSIIKN